MLNVVLAMNADPGPDKKSITQIALSDLVIRIAEKSDKRAFTELFAYFGPRLKGYMMGRGMNAEAAEDLAQETMIRVWNKAAMYSSAKGQVSTWIFTIARNLHIDSVRRDKIVSFTDLADFDQADEDPVSDENLIATEETELVAHAIAKLPGEQKEIIEMAFMKDMTQTEIAGKIGLPLGTVKSRMRLAYQKLSKSLEDL